MTQPAPKNNGHKPPTQPPENLHFRREEFVCKGCRKTFRLLVLEEIDELAQLRCDDALFVRAEILCLRCGRTTYWNMNEKDLKNVAMIYGEVLAKIASYAPE